MQEIFLFVLHSIFVFQLILLWVVYVLLWPVYVTAVSSHTRCFCKESVGLSEINMIYLYSWIKNIFSLSIKDSCNLSCFYFVWAVGLYQVLHQSLSPIDYWKMINITTNLCIDFIICHLYNFSLLLFKWK